MLATIHLFTFSADSTIMINGAMSQSDHISIILWDVPQALQIQRGHNWTSHGYHARPIFQSGPPVNLGNAKNGHPRPQSGNLGVTLDSPIFPPPPPQPISCLCWFSPLILKASLFFSPFQSHGLSIFPYGLKRKCSKIHVIWICSF